MTTPSTLSISPQSSSLSQDINTALKDYFRQAGFFRRYIRYDSDVRALKKIQRQLQDNKITEDNAKEQLLTLAFTAHTRVPLLGFDFFRTSTAVKRCLVQAYTGFVAASTDLKQALQGLQKSRLLKIAETFSRWSLLFAKAKTAYAKLNFEKLKSAFKTIVDAGSRAIDQAQGIDDMEFTAEAQQSPQPPNPAMAASFQDQPPSDCRASHQTTSVGFVAGFFNLFNTKEKHLALCFNAEEQQQLKNCTAPDVCSEVKKAASMQALRRLINETNLAIDKFIVEHHLRLPEHCPPQGSRAASLREYLITEIIKNAFDAKTDQASLEIKVHLTIDDHKRLIVEFIDNGAGFSGVAKGASLSAIPGSTKTATSGQTNLGHSGAGLQLGAAHYDIELSNSSAPNRGAVVRVAFGAKVKLAVNHLDGEMMTRRRRGEP